MDFHSYVRTMAFIRVPTRQELSHAQEWWNEYVNLKMDTYHSLREHLCEVQKHVNRLKFIRMKPSGPEQFQVLYNSLPEYWATDLMHIAEARRAEGRVVTIQYCTKELLKIWIQEQIDHVAQEMIASFPSSYP